MMHLLKPRSVPDTSFDAFWGRYPRREKKQAARDAFRWAMQHHNGDGQLLARILATITWQSAQQRDVRYWQMADRWLLGQRWEDEPPVDLAGAAEAAEWAETLRVAAELDAAEAAAKAARRG